MCNLEQILHDDSALLAVVAGKDGGRALMQFFDGCQPRQPERLASGHHRERKCCDEGKRQSDEAEAFAAREQILDQTDDAESDPEQRQPGNAGPEQCAPGKAASRRKRRCDRHRQIRRIRLRRDLDGGAAEPGRLVGPGNDDAGVVEPERRRSP